MTTPLLHTPLTISFHALQRWQQRVDAQAGLTEARLGILQILSLGKRRSRPRHWMADRPPSPGTHFYYWAKRPGVCVIVADGVAVTVVTRDLAKASRDDRMRVLAARECSHLKRVDAADERRWRWDGTLGDDDALEEAA